MRNLLLYTIAVICTLSFSSHLLAENVTVDRSEDGVVTIVGDLFFEGERRSFPYVSIHIRNGLVSVEGRYNTTVNQHNASIEYAAEAVSAISVSGVSDVLFELHESLLADISINAISVTVENPIPVVPFPCIVGHTSFRSVRAGGVFNISGVDFVGDVDFSTGHNGEIISIGRNSAGFVAPVTIYGNVTMNTGHATGYVLVAHTDVFGSVLVDLGQDNDFCDWE